MEVNIDGRFIEFKTFPWGPDLIEVLDLKKIKIELFYITKEEIESIKFHDFEKHIEIDIKDGYIIKIKSNLLNCIKYINIEKKYFDTIYNEIHKMDFENIVVNSLTGCDGGQFEIKIGLNNGLNSFSKKIGLWCPPSTKDEVSVMEINKLLKIYDAIKEKINYKAWYKNILLKEKEIYKKYEE